ncbi:MAG: tRNA lysidine(34) synthetase TilS [Wenzhouxiangella sp.]|nr:tRNA lysidine(34) synthetase TilS [Wenzhouxiangella sp.]MCH8478380.1 tRNA lysidine(34) synthetase TilS [Wenzhouxiangella sp.]TVR97310.1 MAG: tRNA lysidine(34) synthetase TilS [Wenzhouxiangellaceae bacterium]
MSELADSCWPPVPEASDYPGRGRILIAFSGGADSVCLAAQVARSGTTRTLLAVHVDHGLDPDSAERSERACELAAGLGLQFRLERLALGRGNEAVARRARYQVFEKLLGEEELLLTGHHADDQAETILLRLLRGAGPQGLAGIPRQRSLGRGWVFRPLLAWSRGSILSWLNQHGLSWQDDPTNTDLSIDRNFLRHRIVPLLESRWPGLRQRLGRSAALGAGAVEALDWLAEEDLQVVQIDRYRLDLQALLALNRFRQGQVLRYWCIQHALSPPPASQLDSFIDQMGQARADRQPRLQLGSRVLSCWRGHIWMDRDYPEFASWQTNWSGLGMLALPGRLGSLALRGGEAPFSNLLQVRLGRQGERIALPGRCGRHALNQLMAEAGIPPWQRRLWPRLELDGELVAVGTRWLADGFRELLAQRQVALEWRDRPAELSG